MGKVTTYGLGGFDPTKPNNNIVDEVEVDDPVPVEDLAVVSQIDELYGLVADLYAQTGVDAAPLLESETVSETAKSAVLAAEAARARADGDLFQVEDTEAKPVEHTNQNEEL